jgi:hypothetical protein
MPKTNLDLRRKAVSELKNQIQRALARQQIEAPQFHIAVDPAYQSVDLTFTGADGTPITTEFSGDELDQLKEHPWPETLAKIERVTGLLRLESQKPTRRR